MSSTLSFFRTVGITKLGNIGDSMVSWYAQHDPETASAADIAELGQRAEALAHRIAEIQGQSEHDQHTVDALNLKLSNDKRAATVLGERLTAAQTAGNAVIVTQITAQITPVLAEIEQLAGEDGTGTTSGQLFDAQQSLNTDSEDLAQFREAHTRAVNDWTGAQARLQHARSNMEHAQHEQQIAQQRAAQAERDAGLLGHGSAPGHTALDAMEKQAEKLRTDARAATIQADALRHQGGGDVADIVAATLATQPTDKGNDALAKLARLTGKT
jgi:hypothetical protein